MKRLRSTWLALMGGALLVTLSFSAAFGAPPTESEDGPRGQSVSAFVHSLVFGQDDPEQEEEELEEEQDLEEEQNLEEVELELENGEEADAHGACVSEVAHDKEGVNDPEDAEYRNHGERVTEAARFLCWQTAEEEEPEALLEQEESSDDGDDEADAGSTAGGPGKSGEARANGNGNGNANVSGKANAPGQQNAKPAATGNGRGGGQGRGGR